MRIFSPKYFARLSRECRTMVVRRSCECRREILANLQCEIHMNVVRVSYNGRTTVLRKHANTSRLSGEKIKLSRETLSRMSCDCCAIVMRQSRDIFSKLDLNSRICRINVYSVRLHCESCVYIVNLCREIVTNYSRTSLQLSHSSEIGL